ncbi:MAG TPA: hypothetical protein GXX73_14240 [Clostridium sp.]|nr:hypothetical protein [Clostridium sp.]
MFAIICSEKNFQDIEQMVQAVNDVIVYQAIGDDIDINELDKISRISVSHLIIDITCLSDKNSFVTAIRNYKIKVSNTKIILIYPNAVPGDAICAALVRMGVYDIIAPTLEDGEELILLPSLLSVFEKPTTYAAAVKWDQGPVDSNIDTDKKENISKLVNSLPYEKRKELGLIVEKETTIIKDRILGTIVICIAGANKSIGCTHAAIQIASFFAQHKEKFKVALLQMNSSDHFQKLNKILECPPVSDKLQNSFSFKNIDFIYDTSLLEVKQHNEYDYIVVDIGTLKKTLKHQELMVNANMSILVCNSKPWQLESIKEAIFEDYEDYEKSKKWKLVFPLSDDDFFKFFKQEFKYWEVYKLGYCPSLFSLSADTKKELAEIVYNVLPKVVKGGK